MGIKTMELSGTEGDLSQDGVKLVHIVKWALSLKRAVHSGAHSDSNHWKDVTPGPWNVSGGNVVVEANENTLPTRKFLTFNGTTDSGMDCTSEITLGEPIGVGANEESGEVEKITYSVEGGGSLKTGACKPESPQ